ncbi:Gfo/Idh/MocA family oxidoreductase [candidate division KSB1 bacterium]|nr:Gfo/Idh/MocA family oxidoreductase [candidate division KSB1 bacterium]
MSPISLGIIGCGIAARDLHWPALDHLNREFKIVQVCNHTEPKAKSFAEMIGDVPYVLDYHELLENPDIEAVDIAVPIHVNFSICRDAMKAGKHIILEKPISANERQAKQLLDLSKQTEHVMMIAENFRYRPTLLRLKSLLESGTIGQPFAVKWNILYNIAPDNKYAQTLWRINHQYAGGFITDGGIHNIAALRMLFGDIHSGQGRSMSVNSGLGDIDTFMFQFTTQSGMIGELTICCSAQGVSDGTLLILGTKGSIKVPGSTIEIFPASGEPRTEEIADDGGYVDQFRDFHTAIRSGRPVHSSFEEGYHDLVTMLGAIRSAETGSPFFKA